MSIQKYEMVAKTFDGLEDVLKEELIEIGASDVEVLIRGVKFTGPKELLYKANFCCRTALRILVTVKVFNVKSSNDLYNGVRSIPWTDFFDLQQTFSVNSTVNSEAFNNSMFVSLKTKDAVVDQFKSILGKRPSVNTENPDIRIHVHASADQVSISLDSSGESLHKRGYRLGQNEASMSEVLAAGLLKIAGWKGQCDFYDPMCGSGTIPIEAALIARNIPPGIFRKSFAFEKWKDFDEELFDKVYNADYEKPFENVIYASDIASVNVKISTENARNAGLKKDIVFSVADFASLKPVKSTGLLIINPPYGQRMNDRMVEPLYNMIGNSLKNNFKGIDAWVFSGSDEGFRSIGLRPSSKIKLINGSLECEFRHFEMYAGSLPHPKQEFRQRPTGDQQRTGNNSRTFNRNDNKTNRPNNDSRFGNNRNQRSDRPDDQQQQRTTNRPSPRRSDDFIGNGNRGNAPQRGNFKSRNNDNANRTQERPDSQNRKPATRWQDDKKPNASGENTGKPQSNFKPRNSNNNTDSNTIKKDKKPQGSPSGVKTNPNTEKRSTPRNRIKPQITEDPKRSFGQTGNSGAK